MAADTVSTHTIAGKTFRATARTAAHIKWTIDELNRLHPEARLVILQPCYNTGVAASAGTHDYDAVLDYRIDNLDWWAGQRFLRSKGWAAWFRHEGAWANPAAWHFHAISLGYVGRVGIYVPGQVEDYYAHAYGLKDLHRAGSDTSWFPPDIKATVFSYQNWLIRETTKAAPTPTVYDLTIALDRLARATKNPVARGLYLSAKKAIGPLVTDADRVKVPTTVNGVVAALKAKQPLLSGASKARITAAIAFLRPLT